MAWRPWSSNTDRNEGVLLEKLGCYGDSREILRIVGMGGAYANQGRILGATSWQFEGQEIFKKAVHGMGLRPARTCCSAAAGRG
jgi:3-oxoacyl-[acyl-carrier-protein] synthase-3